MVSALKLWHHPENKRLWPVVSGLSVLAHVGILGLSLPYFLDLMQAGSATQAAAPIPIELVDADSDSELTFDSSKIQQDSSSGQTADARLREESASSLEELSERSQAPEPQQTAIANNPPIAAPTRSPNPSVEQTRPDTAPTNPPEPEPAAKSDETGTSREPTSKDDDVENSSAGDGDPTDTDASNSTPSEEGTAPEETIENSDELPTVPEEGETLSPPGQDSSVPQQTALSIVGFSEVPEAQRSDLGKTPPQPKAEALSNGIVIDPVSRNCPRMAFSQQRWTYRIAVNPNGSVRTASVWTEGISRGMSEEERAIACLIENAGFEFEPALTLSDGQPILDDNLLIEVDITEAP